MKIRKSKITGLRGAPVPFELKLDAMSTFILGESGHGKSTITDGLELWSTGGLDGYHRHGAELDAAVNIDSLEALVILDITGRGAVRRSLRGRDVSALEAAETDPPVLREVSSEQHAASEITPLPMLRHETMGRFMDRTAGEKKKELLQLLGLEELVPFREALKTACNNLKAHRNETRQRRDREQGSLDRLCSGRTPVAAAEELRQSAELAGPVTTEKALRELTLDAAPASTGPNRAALVSELGAAYDAMPQDPSEAWNDLVQDRRLLEVETLSTLVATGQRVLAVQQEEVCPLCRSDYDHERLSKELEERGKALAETAGKVASARTSLANVESSLKRVVTAIGAVLNAPPTSGWTVESQLEHMKRNCEWYLSALVKARQDFLACPALPATPEPETMRVLDAETKAAAGSAQRAALLELKALKDQFDRLDEERSRLVGAEARGKAASRTLEIADERIEKAIRDALAELSELIGRYYSQLAYGGLYTDIQLEYRTQYSGGVEFSVHFDGRKRISPPQAIMSTSQLNALGLALFLARAKKLEPNWRTIVLDDVVNSFDSSFRQGLIRVLASDFADWQIILLSHDRAFADIAQREAGAGWRHWQIVQWTPAGGPILGAARPLDRLGELLSEGRPAVELAGWARQALEGTLGHIVNKLAYEVPYLPSGRYSAGHFIRALRKGLAHSNAELAAKPVLARIEGDSYMTALGVHGREDASALSAGDYARLVADLNQLQQDLRCDECGEPAWKAESGTKHQCKCSKLVA